MKRELSPLVCARCGCAVGWWYGGWKHQRCGHSPPSCGQRPVPVQRPIAKGQNT